MSLPSAPLGKNGPSVPRIGYGGMGLSVFYGTPKPDPERLAILDHLYAKGERWWETADFYGDNEALIGKWLAANPDKRKDIFLATKTGPKHTAAGFSIDMSPAGVHAALDASLAKLGVDHVDLYYILRVDPKVPIEVTVGALVEAKQQGKISHFGLSECSAATLRRAAAVHQIAAVQLEYSPATLDIEDSSVGLLAAAREVGTAIVAYSPLSRGLLTNTIHTADFADGDFRKTAPRFSAENLETNLGLTKTIAGIAARRGITPAQLSLAWLLAQGQDIFPIPGSTKTERIDENLGALAVELTPAEVAEVRAAIEASPVAGHRYRAAVHSMLHADTPELK